MNTLDAGGVRKRYLHTTALAGVDVTAAPGQVVDAQVQLGRPQLGQDLGAGGIAHQK